jgi:hypothetical protein
MHIEFWEETSSVLNILRGPISSGCCIGFKGSGGHVTGVSIFSISK